MLVIYVETLQCLPMSAERGGVEISNIIFVLIVYSHRDLNVYF